jgi:hypothetical protein
VDARTVPRRIDGIRALLAPTKKLLWVFAVIGMILILAYVALMVVGALAS